VSSGAGAGAGGVAPTPAERLASEPTCWLATVRPDGRPHLTPIWFVFHDGRFWLCTTPRSVKVANVRADPRVSVSLESGTSPVVAEGRAVLHEGPPFAPPVVAAFVEKFDWDLDHDTDAPDYTVLVEITITKWLMGSPE
jgi:PPOX class probable F420-dependent enzyme